MSVASDTPVILSARRTAIGAFLGTLSGIPAHELGAHVIRAAVLDAGIAPEDVDEVLLGQILCAGQGQNPARQAAIKAGVPVERTAVGLNQLCGSGLRTVAMAAQSVRLGDAKFVVAGGQESMTLAPHALQIRSGIKMGEATMTDTMISDGLWCAIAGYHMGNTAQNIADKWQLSRLEQDEFAVSSQNKAEQSIKDGLFKSEIVPIEVKRRREVITFDTDEFPRVGVTVDDLAKLRPAFSKEGSITAGNASGINDGAAAVVVTTLAEAHKLGIQPLARIVSWATAGVDPSVMGTGPIPASRLALDKAQWTIDDVDLFESNEAFAAQALAVIRELGLPVQKVNVNGGAIALGHPIGASGARVLTTLLHALKSRDQKRGLATLCIGGGMGIAMCVERF